VTGESTDAHSTLQRPSIEHNAIQSQTTNYETPVTGH
jgi:hypothetical protein